MPITIHPLRPSLIPSTASLAAYAFTSDPLIAHLCPYRHDYWTDFVDSYVRRIREKVFSEGWVLVVAIDTREQDGEEGEGEGEGEVVGYAAWERWGTSEDAERWRGCVGGGDVDTIGEEGWKSWAWRKWCALQRTLATTQHNYTTDRALSRENLDAYNALTSDTFPETEYPEFLYLGVLAVHPDHQRRGIGSKLLNWGLERARREGVRVGTEASPAGKGLYEKFGLEVVREVVWDEGRGEEGRSPVMLWEPRKK